MASLPTRTTASFDAIKPVSSLILLDDELNDMKGAAGFLNGGTTGKKLLIKSSDGADPPVDSDQIGAGLLARWKQNGSSKATITNDGSLTANGLTGAAGTYTFGQIPVLPGADPTLPNQAVRKAYVDSRKTAWSMNWFIEDPSNFPINNFSQIQKVKIPANSNFFTATGMSVMYSAGTASGSFQISIRKHPPNAQATQTILGTINTNPGVVGNEIFLDIPDHTFIAGDYVFFILDSISAPLQRQVSISLFGAQLVF